MLLCSLLCPHPEMCQRRPALPWVFSLQRSSCGKMRTQGGLGERMGRGRERMPGALSSAVVRGQPPSVPSWSSVLKAQGWRIGFRRTSPPHPSKSNTKSPTVRGRKRMFLHIRGGLFSTGRCSSLSLLVTGTFQRYLLPVHHTIAGSPLNCPGYPQYPPGKKTAGPGR